MLPIKSVNDEMAYMSSVIDGLRSELVAFSNSERKIQVLTAIDRWKQDVASLPEGSLKFFDTIPFFDRLDAIHGLVVGLRGNQMAIAAAAVTI